MPIPSTTLRIIQKNPNGFHTRHNTTCTKLTNGLQDMSDLDAGVILFNETNTDWQNYDLREEYNHRIKKHWPIEPTSLPAQLAQTTTIFPEARPQQSWANGSAGSYSPQRIPHAWAAGRPSNSEDKSKKKYG